MSGGLTINLCFLDPRGTAARGRQRRTATIQSISPAQVREGGGPSTFSVSWLCPIAEVAEVSFCIIDLPFTATSVQLDVVQRVTELSHGKATRLYADHPGCFRC